MGMYLLKEEMIVVDIGRSVAQRSSTLYHVQCSAKNLYALTKEI